PQRHVVREQERDPREAEDEEPQRGPTPTASLPAKPGAHGANIRIELVPGVLPHCPSVLPLFRNCQSQSAVRSVGAGSSSSLGGNLQSPCSKERPRTSQTPGRPARKGQWPRALSQEMRRRPAGGTSASHRTRSRSSRSSSSTISFVSRSSMARRQIGR